MPDTSIPALVRSARMALGLTQKALGLAVGYSEASAERRIQHIEYGTRPLPMRDLRKFAAVLKLKPEELIP